ncbi:hypothetical protein BDV12DRAFT_202695 [Aspergillus spectabilis]
MPNVGDKIRQTNSNVGSNTVGEIIEVRGPNGRPPLCFDYGRQTLIFPGPDTTIESTGDT